MGAFDDLIPGNGAAAVADPPSAPTGDPFADLIPKSSADPFADLIPGASNEKSPVAASVSDTAAPLQVRHIPQPEITASPTFASALAEGDIGTASHIAYETARRPFSGILGPTEAERIEHAVPVHDANGNVTYEYKPLGSRLDQEGGLATPLIKVQPFAPAEGDSKAMAALKATGNVVQGLVGSVESPLGAMLPGAGEIPGVARAASAAFAGDMAANAPGQLQKVVTGQNLQEKIEGGLGFVSSALMASLAGEHALKTPEAKAAKVSELLKSAPQESLEAAATDPEFRKTAPYDPALIDQEIARRAKIVAPVADATTALKSAADAASDDLPNAAREAAALADAIEAKAREKAAKPPEPVAEAEPAEPLATAEESPSEPPVSPTEEAPSPSEEPAPEKMVAAAYQTPDGRTFTGVDHMDADEKAREAGVAVDNSMAGFVNKDGKFFNREDAYKAAKSQVIPEEDTFQPGRLHTGKMEPFEEPQTAPRHEETTGAPAAESPARNISLEKLDALHESLADETAAAEPPAPQEPKPALRIVPHGDRFKLVNAADEQVGKKTYQTEAHAKQALSKIGKRSTFGIPPSESGNDIIDSIIEQGGINLSGLSKEERDAAFPHKGTWRNALTTDNPNLTPDEVARLIAPSEGQAGHGDGDMRTMFSEIDKAIKSRKALRDQAAAEERNQKAEVKKARAFERAALTPKEGEPATAASDLKVGDEIEVDGEKCTVTHIDPDTGDVTMKDGAKFGVRVIEDGKVIYGELKTAEEDALDAWPDFEADKPVDIPKEAEEYAATHGLTDENQPSLESPAGGGKKGHPDTEGQDRDGGAGKSAEGSTAASQGEVGGDLISGGDVNTGRTANVTNENDGTLVRVGGQVVAKLNQNVKGEFVPELNEAGARLTNEQKASVNSAAADYTKTWRAAKIREGANKSLSASDLTTQLDMLESGRSDTPLFEGKADKFEAFLDKAIDDLKSKPGELFSDPLFIQSVGKPVLRAALQVVRAAYKGGKAAADAIADGMAYLRANVKDLDEAKAKEFFDAIYEDAPKSSAPPEPPRESTATPTSERPPNTTGIAQRIHEQRAPGEIVPGEGATPEQMIQQGRDDLKAGADPEAVAAKIDRGEAITGRETALIRAHLEELSKAANRAGDAAEANPGNEALKKAATDALKAETNFRKRIKPAGTEFHRVGVAMQGETDIDTGSFTGLRRAFSEAAGRDMNVPEKEKAREYVDQIKQKDAEIAELQAKLNEAISGKSTATSPADTTRTYEKTVSEIKKAAKGAKKSGGTVTDFLDKQAEAARARIIARRGKLFATVDPLNLAGLADEIVIGASHLAHGISDLSAWSAKMLSDFGERIRPVLSELFEKAKELHRTSEEAFQKAKTVAKPEEMVARAKAEAENGEELSHKTVYDVARAHINAGIHGENAVMKATHESLKQAYPDLTEKDVRSAFSEYGKMKFPSKEPDKVELAKIRRLTQMQLAIDDLKAGRDPLHSGLQRAKADLEIRERQQELNDAIKEHAGNGAPSPEKLASREQAKQTALRNAIEAADKELRTGEKRARAANQPDSPETEQLRSELGAMREKLKEIEDASKPVKTEDEKKLAALEKQEKALAEQIRTGKIETESGKPTADTAAVAAAKERVAALRDQIAQMRKAARDAAKPTEAERQAKFAEALRTHFEGRIKDGKFDGKFTPKELKGIWERAKVYIDAGSRNFSEMAASVAGDLGLKPEWVKDALSQNKTVRNLTNELYRKMYDRRQMTTAAKQWVESANKPTYIKVIRAITNYPRAISVLGHANAMITHAGQNAFRPSAWVPWGRNLVNNYKFFARPSIHEAAMQALVNHPDYNLALRSKLRVAPGMVEDYAAYGKFLGAVGEAGNRAMDSLKTFRMDYFSKELSRFAPEIRNEVAPLLAQWINHISGFGDIGFGKHAEVMRESMFAPSLEASRWANVVGDPVKYARVFADWKNASPADKAMAKFYINRTAQLATAVIGTLAANYGLQTATGQTDRVNFTDPTKSDWLKFKWNGRTYDPMGGLTGPLRLIATLFHDVNPYNKRFRGENRLEKVGEDALFYARGKLDPKYAMAADLLDGKNMVGRPMPTSGDKGTPSHPKISWSEYAWSHAPIPMAEAMREVYDGLHGQGLDHATARDIIAGLVAFAIGAFGVKEGKTPKSTK